MPSKRNINRPKKGRANSQGAEIERIFRQHEQILIHWLTKKLGDAEAAHDVAQSAFSQIWQYSKNNKIENPKALLFKTAANLALNELRRRNRFLKRNVFASDLIEHGMLKHKASSEPTPEEEISTRQQAKLLLAAIDRLPPKLRTTYKLHRFEGLSYKQIAKKLGVSVSSVEKYMIEALSALRALILPDAQNKKTKPCSYKSMSITTPTRSCERDKPAPHASMNEENNG